MYNIYYTENSALDEFAKQLKKKFSVFSPAVKKGNFTKQADYSYKKHADSETVIFNPYRAVEPLKSFFTYPKEKIARYFSGDVSINDPGKKVIFGVKSCDLYAHRIQDFVFLEGVEVDSLYRLRRQDTILISGDCTDIKGVCHCLAWDVMPYPTAGFDLNMSVLNEGYLVEVGSDKGKALLEEHSRYFVPAKDSQITARMAKRESIVQRLRRHLLAQNLVRKDTVQRLVKEGYHANTWKQFMLTCVECGGCNFICDTCHCFLLSDQKKNKDNERLRLWDACLYANYARVAGGANPLKLRAERLRFRFTKKFDFFVDNLGIPACCGCGRCIEVCPGKIDIREVLKDLAVKTGIK